MIGRVYFAGGHPNVVQAVWDGKADAGSAYYVPPGDVHTALLRPSSHVTFCEWKGQASYFSVAVGDRVAAEDSLIVLESDKASMEIPSPHEGIVRELLVELGLAGRKVAVELHRDILAREDYSTRRLAAGDVVEVVQFVGGG